uniref:Programmed cell death 5 n=1 Tax=Cyprinus carpio carpio TaxID=630221 RepID=A0A9J8AXN6_CYPCA
MADEELEAIRRQRMTELQAKHGDPSSDQQGQQEAKQREMEMRNSILAQVLDQSARARLSPSLTSRARLKLQPAHNSASSAYAQPRASQDVTSTTTELPANQQPRETSFSATTKGNPVTQASQVTYLQTLICTGVI